MNNTRGIYIENLTAEIFNTLTEVLNPNISDNDFLKAQVRVRKIIAREYVEVKDQEVSKSHHKKGPRPIRYTIG